MAYTADINIVVKGQAVVDSLQQSLIKVGNKIDELTKKRVGPSTALDTFNNQLKEAERRLTAVAAGTSTEAEAIKNYVTALGNANAAVTRQNKLIQDEINLRESATGQLEKLTARQEEFTARTDEAARAASRQTAEFYRQQRIAKEVAKINAAAPTPQLLLAPAAPGASAMGGGARPLITGPVERLGGARTQDQADTALRFAQALKEQVRPLSQIDALYAGIAKETSRLQQIKALPDTAMLNATARGLTTLETAQDRYNRELAESATRLQQLDRLEESRTRRAAKLRQIQEYYDTPSAMENAGFGVQTPRVPPRPPKAAVRNPIAGSLGFNPAASAENIALGAGFPLLFGGGAGQVAGGFAGSFFGGGFGGQILGSAIGQILEDAQRRITEIGNAVRQLNMDNLRSSVVYVNAELDTTVRRLVEAGKSQQALAVAAEAVTQQTGLVPKAVDNITTNVTVLGNTWNQFVSAISGTLALLGAPFVQVITMILSGWTKIFQYANLIGSSLRAWGLALLEGVLKKYPILQFLLNNVLNGVKLVTEEEQRRAAALQTVIDKQSAEIANNAKNLAIEKQRTLGRTTAEKQINIEVERGLELNKIETEYDARKKQYLIDHVGLEQAKLNEGLLQIEQLRQQAVDQANIKLLLQEQALEIEANTERYKQAAEAINQQIESLERANALKQSGFQAEAALNDLYAAQLEKQYRLATTAEERYNIAIAQFNQQVKAAYIEYKQAIANNRLLVDKAQLQTQLVQLKYQELAAEKEIAIAQAIARGNTSAQISAIAEGYNKALGVQGQAVELAYEQSNATKVMAANQDIVADAIYKTKVLQAESTLAQKLSSDEIGVSKDNANYLAARMSDVAMQATYSRKQTETLTGVIKVGTQQTYIMASAMGDVAANAQVAAYNIERAFKAQLALNRARGGGGSAPAKAAEGAFWPGGFKAFAQGGVVTRPTLGLIGEGGESEYIVPESKAAGFATNYLFGERGAGAIPSSAESNSGAPIGAPVINITTGPVVEFNGERYVTVADMERAMRATANGVIGRLRSTSARVALGMA